MKVHEVRRALASAPDNADVYVDEDSIRFVPETERAPPPTPSDVASAAPTIPPQTTFDSTVCMAPDSLEPFELPKLPPAIEFPPQPPGLTSPYDWPPWPSRPKSNGFTGRLGLCKVCGEVNSHIIHDTKNQGYLPSERKCHAFEAP